MNSGELNDLLTTSYAAVTTAASEATDADLLGPSGCAGWSAADLLVHLMADARRALVTFATPAAGPADTDGVSYWRAGAESVDAGSRQPDAQAHALHIRRLSVAYSRPASIVREWTDTSQAAARAAAAADPAGLVATQGHILSVTDFVATLVVEATIHLIDLSVALPGAQPPAGALALTAQTMTALLEVTPPSDWTPVELITKVTGRSALTAADRDELGPRADTLALHL